MSDFSVPQRTMEFTVSELQTDPAIAELGTTETLPWPFDCSDRVAQVEGGVVSNPVVTVSDLSEVGEPSTPDALEGDATVSGNVITQTFTGASLTPGHEYRAILTFDLAEGNTQSAELEIRVPF
jgi:hypothetical protein